jgi:SdpC family antimicrobial peptide
MAKTWEKHLAVILTVLMVFSATGNAWTQTSAAAARYDGETIFRGVLLGDGPVAKLFPEFWGRAQLASYQKLAAERGSQEQLATAKQQIIDMLRTQDPTFFNRFGSEMQSGDPIRIQQAITEAGSRLQKQVQSRFSTDASAPVIPVQVAVDAYYYYYYYYYAAAAAAVVIVIAAALVVVIDAIDSNNPNSNLERDVYVGQIAQRLGPAAAK